MSEQRLESDLRDRAVLPVLIPVVAIVVTEILVFSLSRVLLTAGKDPAVAIALGMALAILIGATGIAMRPRLRTASIVGLLVLAGLALVAAGAVAARRGPTYGSEGGEAKPVAVSAADLAFDTKKIELSAEKAEIDFSNSDAVQHNIAIFASEDELDKALFRGKIVDAGARATYEVSLDPGTYYFHCDVHPTDMTGSVVVE